MLIFMYNDLNYEITKTLWALTFVCIGNKRWSVYKPFNNPYSQPPNSKKKQKNTVLETEMS